jgi:hypothetical protein
MKKPAIQTKNINPRYPVTQVKNINPAIQAKNIEFTTKRPDTKENYTDFTIHILYDSPLINIRKSIFLKKKNMICDINLASLHLHLYPLLYAKQKVLVKFI